MGDEGEKSRNGIYRMLRTLQTTSYNRPIVICPNFSLLFAVSQLYMLDTEVHAQVCKVPVLISVNVVLRLDIPLKTLRILMELSPHKFTTRLTL